MNIKSLTKLILIITISGLASSKSFAQDMILLCYPTASVKSHLSAYPERLSIKEYKEGINKDEKGISHNWAKLIIHDNLLNCDWQYLFSDNKCNSILITLNKETDLENWIEVLDKQFYRISSNGKTIWVENGKTIPSAATAKIDRDTKSVFFMKLTCD